MEIELSGYIEFKSGQYGQIKLVQENGFKVDLVGRFKEAVESYPEMSLQVSYFLSETPKTKDEMVEGFLKKLYGGVHAAYEASEYCYSSYTRGVDYETHLKIGGHDLYRELYDHQGKYIVIVLSFNP